MFIARNVGAKMSQCMMMAFASAMAVGISGMRSKYYPYDLKNGDLY